MSDPLIQATAVLRAISGDDPDCAVATRLRIRRDLEHRAHGRRRFAIFGILLGVMFGGTTAWALATDNVGRMWSAIAGEATLPERRTNAVATAELTPRRASEPQPQPQSAVPREPTWSEPSPPIAQPPPPAPSRPAPRPRVATPAPAVDVLYRHAHELHFRGDDPQAAIAAWDAYLAAEPSGRFAIEARYNRALLWIRVGRYHDAHAALLPFAHGEVTPRGYRQDEAAQLVARLARLNDPKPSGHDAP